MEPDKKRLLQKQPVKLTPMIARNRSETNSPRLSARQPHRPPIQNSNNVNGNVHPKTTAVDVENNATLLIKPPSAVSRSGTFLKDEPTIIRKNESDIV